MCIRTQTHWFSTSVLHALRLGVSVCVCVCTYPLQCQEHTHAEDCIGGWKYGKNLVSRTLEIAFAAAAPLLSNGPSMQDQRKCQEDGGGSECGVYSAEAIFPVGDRRRRFSGRKA